MNFMQYSEHIEQRIKREYDSSGPINFVRHHFPGRLGHIEFTESIVLRQTTQCLEENEDFADRKALKRKSIFDKIGDMIIGD